MPQDARCDRRRRRPGRALEDAGRDRTAAGGLAGPGLGVRRGSRLGAQAHAARGRRTKPVLQRRGRGRPGRRVEADGAAARAHEGSALEHLARRAACRGRGRARPGRRGSCRSTPAPRRSRRRRPRPRLRAAQRHAEDGPGPSEAASASPRASGSSRSPGTGARPPSRSASVMSRKAGRARSRHESLARRSNTKSRNTDGSWKLVAGRLRPRHLHGVLLRVRPCRRAARCGTR